MALLSCRIVDQIWMSRNPLYSHFFWLKCASPPPSLVSNYKEIVELSVAKSQGHPCAFNWSLSRPIVRLIHFLSSLDIRVWPIFKKGLTKNSKEWAKKVPSLSKYKSFLANKKIREIDWTIGWSIRLIKSHRRPSH